MASGGWPMLDEMDGEPVAYSREVGGSVATGFPKDIRVLFRVDRIERGTHNDGRGDLHTAMMRVKLADVGSLVQIEDDKVTRADSVVWTVTEVLEVVAGVASCRMQRFVATAKGARNMRIER